MKRNLKKVVLVLALLLPGVIKAQEFNVTAKADFVSDYIWRGAYQNSGFSVQPTLGLSYGNLSLSAWGSQSLTKYNPQNEMFRLLGTKRSFSQNETFFFSHPYPALFRLISHF